MTTTTKQSTPNAIADLTFARGVERELVHRAAIAEVFVTDLVHISDTEFVAGAQLPRAHHYYDNPSTLGGELDCLLLQECCRQASTLLVHRHFDLPLHTTFLLTRWRMGTDRQAPVTSRAPGELAMGIRVGEQNVRDGQLAALSLSLDLWLGGERIGDMDIDAAYLPPERYATLRSARRELPPPRSDQMPPRGSDMPAAPRLVGRQRGDNVVLADLAVDRRSALLDVPRTHPSLYDHPLDHVPAMGLLEATRQLTVAATGRQPSGMDAQFTRFVELDVPAEITAEPDGDDMGDGLLVRVVQDGAYACKVAVTS